MVRVFKNHFLNLGVLLSVLCSAVQKDTHWNPALKAISSGRKTSSEIGGYATRLLSDRQVLAGDELVNTFYYAMSPSSVPVESASWLEGFLKRKRNDLIN
jgi:hypothetical protein